MTISNLQLFGLVLCPGFAEGVKKHANNNGGNLAISGVASGMKNGRDCFYLGSVLTVIGTVGVVTSGPSLAVMASFGLGFTLTTVATKKIYEAVEIFQDSIKLTPHCSKFE